MTAEPPPDQMFDDALVAQVASGDKHAFTALFQRHKNDVYRVALLMTGRSAVAEDVTQDVFLAIMREAHRYEPGRSTVAAWLCGIARNQARRRLERDSRVVPLGDGDEWRGGGQPASHPDPVSDMTLARDVEALRRAVLALPVRYREVIVLCDLQELSYADAAAALECAVGTVRSRLHRGRTLLAAKMRRHGDVRGSMVKGCLA